MVRRSGGWKVRRFRGGLIVLSAYCLVVSAGVASAEDPSMAGDKAELQLLRARLEKLEKRVEEADAKQLTGVSDIGQKPGAAIMMLPSGIQGLGMSGYVDTSYVYNFEHPDPGTPIDLSGTFHPRMDRLNSIDAVPQVTFFLMFG